MGVLSDSHLCFGSHVESQGTLCQVQLLDGHTQRTEVRVLAQHLRRRWYIEGKVQVFVQLPVFERLAVDPTGQTANQEAARAKHASAWLRLT